MIMLRIIVLGITMLNVIKVISMRILGIILVKIYRTTLKIKSKKLLIILLRIMSMII